MFGFDCLTFGGVESLLVDLEELYFCRWRVWGGEISHIGNDRSLMHAGDRRPVELDFSTRSDWSLQKRWSWVDAA